MSQIDVLIHSIGLDFKAKKFDKFIHDATLPNFKNFAPFTKITFDFPVTVLVGPNGGGKSSILQAAWGMPFRHSTSKFWFSTPVDPIEETRDGEKNIPRYWYSHYIKALDVIAQTRKVKGQKRAGYWEPSKPSTEDGMERVPVGEPSEFRSTDRWTPVARKVTYINTKADTSAFDRFFYYTEITHQDDKQKHFIKESARLRNVIDRNLTKKKIGRGEFVFGNDLVDPAILKVINKILGKKYISARYITHRFYDRNKSSSVIFQTNEHTYSECFAGSGELSVVNMVLKIEKLEQFELLLLDEPETSLHPGAQNALLEYILRIMKDKKIQVIISTHSPTIVELLPEKALVVLQDSEKGTVVKADATKSSAFYRLGHPDPNKITIVTEDILLKVLVERAIERLEPDISRRCDVVAAIAGASEMLSHQIPAFITAGNSALIVMDGDQQDFYNLICQDPDDMSSRSRARFIEQLKGCNVTIVGSNPNVESYIKWCKQRVLLINETCPEQVFLQLLKPDHPKLGNATNNEYKRFIDKELHNRGDDTSSAAAAAIFKSKLGESKGTGNVTDISVSALAERIKQMINALG